MLSAKIFLRNLRDGGPHSAWNYMLAPKIRKKIKELADGNVLDGFEIHILTGADRLDMALWMAASWIVTTNRCWKFVFHSDKNSNSNEFPQISEILPGSRLITNQESEFIVGKKLERFPLSWRCRNLHPLCRKLFDIPILASDEKFLTIDTDILFFKKPERILRWIDSNEDTSIFMHDVADSTLPAIIERSEDLGFKILREVNTGIVGMKKKVCALPIIEECLSQTTLLDSPKWFVEQSLYAFLGSLNGNVELLNSNPEIPECYQLNLGVGIFSNSVMRHYVGKVRHLFYSEGISEVKGRGFNL